ncbi:MAG: hypothetical protein ABW149_04725 [Sedimenticola sp.]
MNKPLTILPCDFIKILMSKTLKARVSGSPVFVTSDGDVRKIREIPVSSNFVPRLEYDDESGLFEVIIVSLDIESGQYTGRCESGELITFTHDNIMSLREC